ncbi:hypothetical protein TNCV_217741 [Trichonephila clavipes]|nr:hypothetical protein TNCV_217741 [Trichonephila clavipes]
MDSQFGGHGCSISLRCITDRSALNGVINDEPGAGMVHLPRVVLGLTFQLDFPPPIRSKISAVQGRLDP